MTSTDSSSLNSPDESAELDTPLDAKELAALVKVLAYIIIRMALSTWCMLQKLQIENSGFRRQLRKFSSGAISSASSLASTAAPPNPLEAHAKTFGQLSRGFCVLNELWVPPSHLNQPYPENLRDIGPQHSTRYRNDQTKREGIIAELYHFVPPQFHKNLEGSPFFANEVSTTTIH